MSTLYELFQSQNQVLEQLLRSGEESDEINKTLMNLQVDVPAKVSAYKHLIDRLEAESDYLNEKADEYKAASKVLDNARTRIKDRLKSIMLEFNLDELDGGDVCFKLSKSKASVVINNEELVPEEYTRTVVSKSYDKVRISQDLNANKVVPGCSLSEVFSPKNTD